MSIPREMSYDYYITNSIWVYHKDEDQIKKLCFTLNKYNRYITNSYYDSDDDFDVMMEKYKSCVSESIDRENQKPEMVLYENGAWLCEKYRIKYMDMVSVYLEMKDIIRIIKYTTAHAKDPNSKLEVPILN